MGYDHQNFCESHRLPFSSVRLAHLNLLFFFMLSNETKKYIRLSTTTNPPPSPSPCQTARRYSSLASSSPSPRFLSIIKHKLNNTTTLRLKERTLFGLLSYYLYNLMKKEINRRSKNDGSMNVPSLEILMVRSRGVPYLSKPQALLNIF